MRSNELQSQSHSRILHIQSDIQRSASEVFNSTNNVYKYLAPSTWKMQFIVIHAPNVTTDHHCNFVFINRYIWRKQTEDANNNLNFIILSLKNIFMLK